MSDLQRSAVVPSAPGSWTEPASVGQLGAYLSALQEWTRQRRAELDQIDAAALRSGDAPSYTADLTLAMAIWQSVSQREQELTRLWDGGRLDQIGCARMTQLIWAARSSAAEPVAAAGTGEPMALSLPEAGRLSDTLTAALRARLDFDPVAADVAARVAAVRAALHRCTTHDGAPSAGEPSGPDLPTRRALPDLPALARRLEAVATDARAGADVRGPLSYLEADVARAERDLIVAGATHRQLARDFRQTIARRQEVLGSYQRLRQVWAEARSQVLGDERPPLPDPAALGRVPQRQAELDEFQARLEQVAQQLAEAERSWGDPVAELAQARTRRAALAAPDPATSQGPTAALAPLLQAVDILLTAPPVPLAVVRQLLSGAEDLMAMRESAAEEER